MAEPTGNVLSRGIQFAECQRLHWTFVADYYAKDDPFFDWDLLAPKDQKKKDRAVDESFEAAGDLAVDEDDNPEKPKPGAPKPDDNPIERELVPIKNRWIYAFETGYEESPHKIGKLVREYHADDKGKLTFVDGDARRHVDAKEDGAPVGQPIPEAGLPHARQSDHCHYVFIATRARLGKDAILDIEGRLSGKPSKWRMPSIYKKPVNLGDSLPTGSDGNTFAPVIDPLTLGEYLNRLYRRALNWAINLSVPHQHNPMSKEAAIDARKYQLGTLIKTSLLRDGDPYEIKDHLADEGKVMLEFIKDYEISLAKARDRIEIQIGVLLRFLRSDIWSQARGWYHGLQNPGPDNPAAQSIGHYLNDCHVQLIRRLAETERGATFLIKEVIPNPDGPIAWLFEPPEEEHKARELYEKWYPVARKSVTAVVIGMAELGPQLMVTRKIARTRKMMWATLSRIYPKSFMTGLEHTPDYLRKRLLHLTPEGRRVLLDYDNLEQELKHWIDGEGKACWPHGHKLANPAELARFALVLVEVYNLGNTIYDAYQELTKQDAARRESGFTIANRITLAGLEVLVASEEPITKWGLRMIHDPQTKKTVGKMLAPAAFKLLGAVAGIIEAHIASIEAREAREHGEIGLSRAYRIVWVGATLSAVGSALGCAATIAGAGAEAGAGAAAAAAAGAAAAPTLMAAALSLVTVGVAVIAVGYVIVACVKTTAWQGFAGHCVFGTNRDNGKTPWSGTEFSEWTDSLEGIDIQIRALTAMLCSFKIAGEGKGGSGSSVRIDFGALPPNAKLQIQFSLALDNNTTLTPGYLIDLEHRGIAHSWGGGTDCRQLEGFLIGDRLTALIVGPDFPKDRYIVRSHCFAALQYAESVTDNATGVATGTVPVRGPLRYNILDVGLDHTDILESIDVN